MEKKETIFKVTIGAVIFISALIIIHFKKGRDVVKYKINPRKMITNLPQFNFLDINGDLVKNEDFKGKNLYIQFVDPSDFDDINLIKTVYSKWKDENLNFVVIAKNIEKFKVKIGIGLKNIIVITNDYEKLKSKFNSHPHSGTYHLFNGSGDVVAAGSNYIGYERGVKVFLNQLIKNKYFSISDFIKANENIKNIDWFSDVAKIIEKEEKHYFIISMFTSFSADCESGRIINTLQKIYSQNLNSVYVLAILNADFIKKEDINNLKSQSKVDFPIIIADHRLNQRWSSLMYEFRETDLTDIVFVMDKSGEILKILDQSCKCYNGFFSFVYSLIQNEEAI